MKLKLSPESIYGYNVYGLILCGVVNDISTGYKFGQLSLRLLQKLNAYEFQAKTLCIVNTFINHWKTHAKDVLPYLLEAYKRSMETGELDYAAYSIFSYCYKSYLIGQELHELEIQMVTYTKSIEKLHQYNAIMMLKPYHQAVINLLGTNKTPYKFIGDVCDKKQLLPRLIQLNNRTSIFDLYSNKLILCYLFEQYNEAVLNATYTEHYLDSATAALGVPNFHFYDSLARLACYPDVSPYKQKRCLAKVKANQKKMKQWMHHAPMNNSHKFYLVEAEGFRVIGKDSLATDCYDRAIALAKENDYIHEAALGYELAAKFYLSQGKELIARAYMQYDARG